MNKGKHEMYKNSVGRSTSGLMTQKVKSSQHLLRLEDKEDDFDNECSDRFQLPSLRRQKSWRKDDDTLSNDNSAATSVSWSQEVENVATEKLEEQWVIVEESFYEEDDRLVHKSILDECIQWRTQLPYLRVTGRNSAYIVNSTKHELDSNVSNKQTKKVAENLQANEMFAERNFLTKDEEDSGRYKSNKAKFEDVIDILMEYVISELFPNKENGTDSLCKNLNNALTITPAPVHDPKKPSKDSLGNWMDELTSRDYIGDTSTGLRNRTLEKDRSVQTTRNYVDHQTMRKGRRNSISANKQSNPVGATDYDAVRSKESVCAPHIGRNKLGSVFNEKIVVSPVPFAVSTRESFSTLKRTPIRFTGENMEMSSFQGSARNTSGFRYPANKWTTLRSTSVHSAWHTPVCPAVWPKNVRLAPIDASRLPSSRNRSLAPSPAISHYSRRPLSPISRPAIPKSAHATCDRNDLLQIQGKHIVPLHSSKISLLPAAWDYSPRAARGRKKKSRAKERS